MYNENERRRIATACAKLLAAIEAPHGDLRLACDDLGLDYGWAKPIFDQILGGSMTCRIPDTTTDAIAQGSAQATDDPFGYDDGQRKAIAVAATRVAAAALMLNRTVGESCEIQGLDPIRARPVMALLLDGWLMPGEAETDAKAVDDGMPPQWMRHLYQHLDAEPEDPAKLKAAILRMQDAMLSIPSFGAYSALVREFSGEWPMARPNRPDDDPDAVDRDRDPDLDVQAAYAHLREPERKKYIVSGFTEIMAHFTDDVARVLNANQIHVPADLSRFDDAGLLGLIGATPKVIAQIYEYQVRIGLRAKDTPGGEG